MKLEVLADAESVARRRAEFAAVKARAADRSNPAGRVQSE